MWFPGTPENMYSSSSIIMFSCDAMGIPAEIIDTNLFLNCVYNVDVVKGD